MHVCARLNILNNLCSHKHACEHTIYARRKHTHAHTHFPSCRYASIWISSLWPAGWKVSFSHWELCQFSFHYSTGGVDPHYHNKLYFYRHVQTEEAFQGIRLNFTWPPVFLGNTVFPQLHTPSPTSIFFFFFFLHTEQASLWISYLHWYCILLFQNCMD